MLKLTRPLAVYDLETTGVGTATAKIVEISILKIFPDGSREIKTRKLNPQRPIPRFATAVHGIRQEQVASEPSFGKIAKSLLAYLADCDLCTFNGKRFDLPILTKEFAEVQLDFPTAEVNHIDVFDIFRILHPEKKPRTLSAAVEHFLGRPHSGAHAAEADTIATYEVLQAMLKGPIHRFLPEGLPVTAEELCCPKGLQALGSGHYQSKVSPTRAPVLPAPIRLFQHEQDVTQVVAQLIGICSGILADGEVNEEEATFFANWVRKHAPAKPVWPFTDLLVRIERIFADGICDAEERAELKSVMEALCDFDQPAESTPELDDPLSALPFCIPQPRPLVFAGQQFVVTGKFAYGARSAVFEAIKSLGGIPTDAAPSQSTRYVVVGAFGSQDWINTSQGRKIEKAVQLRAKGTGLQIIAEEHWREYIR